MWPLTGTDRRRSEQRATVIRARKLVGMAFTKACQFNLHGDIEELTSDWSRSAKRDRHVGIPEYVLPPRSRRVGRLFALCTFFEPAW